MIYLISYGTLSGGGLLVANGQNGVGDSIAAGDGPGGAGAGGTIVVNSAGAISGVTIEANGGAGGNQTINSVEGEGPGGGGGGGYIATTNTATTQVNGGHNGTSLTFPAFPANGATQGANGIVTTIPATVGNANFTYTDTLLCPGDSVHFYGAAPLYSNNATTWAWTFMGGSPSTSTLQNPVVYYSSAGTYTVELIVNTCNGADTVIKNIHIIAGLSISIRGKDSICPSAIDSLIAIAPGASSYTWTGGVSCPSCAATSASPTVTTTYTLAVSNGSCTKDTTFTIHVVSPAAAIAISKDTICPGDSVQLIGSGGTTYLWSTGSTSGTIWVKPNTITTYTLHAFEGTCNDSTSVTIHVNPNTTATISAINDTICPFGTATLTATGTGGQVTYMWSTGATSSSINVTDSVTTAYTATVYGVCDSVKKFITVTVIPLSKPVITGDSSACKGLPDTLTVSGGTTYRWSNGLTTAKYITGKINADSIVSVIAFNSLGCADTAHFRIAISPSPTVSVTNPNGCLNSTVVIKASGSGNGPFSYSWSPGGETNDSIVVFDTNQTYTVTVSNGCKSSKIVKLTPDMPVIAACCDKTILQGDDTIMVASGANSYQWTPTVKCLNPPLCDSVQVTPTITTTYTVTGTDSLGCQAERIITIVVETPCFNFIVPNVFTPNNAGAGGLNNVFYIKTTDITSWSITIYDRWGKEIFITSNPLQYWDGKTKSGELAPDGVYYYLINATCQNNNYKKDGFVQLIR